MVNANKIARSATVIAAALAFASEAPVYAQGGYAETEQNTTRVDGNDSSNGGNGIDDKTGLWGLLGLVGLAGLAGLKRRDRHHDVHATRTTHTTTAPRV